MLERWRDGKGTKVDTYRRKTKHKRQFFFKCITLAIVVEPNEHGKQHQFNASFMFFIFD